MQATSFFDLNLINIHKHNPMTPLNNYKLLHKFVIV